LAENKSTIKAQRDGVILRQARDDDLPRVDEIMIECYTPIYDSYINTVGEDVYRGIRRNPDQDWRTEKTARIRKAYHEHPGCMWVLEDAGTVFGFVTFRLFPEQGRLWIEENGVIPERRGQGWATFMLRHLLSHARRLGIRFASVEVDLDDVHIPARRAYQAVGFDRHHHIAIYHQDLERRNPGSTLNTEDE
jgi:ribosomal protein S18 acetylase RimI-like enzyme